MRLSMMMTFLLLSVAGGMLHAKTSENKEKNLVKDYISLQESLAADDMDTAKISLKKMLNNSNGDLKLLIEKSLKADSIHSIRADFKHISIKILELKLSSEYKAAYCSMVKSWWLQNKGKINNPYYGKQMPNCGVFRTYAKDYRTSDSHMH